MTFEQIILLLVTFFGVGFLFERSRRRSAEALNTNLKTKEELLELEKQKKPDPEAKLQADLIKGLKEKMDAKATTEEILKFYDNFFDNVTSRKGSSGSSSPKDE